jgi:hypothetical protein
MRIAELVESLDLPQTQVAERAWDHARRRVRRRRGVAAGGAAALAVASVLGIVGVSGRDHRAAPAPAPTNPTPSVEQRTAPLVQWLWLRGHWRSEVSDLDFSRIPGSAAPPGLSTDPVGHAALAINDPGLRSRVLVLGEDGRWREVDVPGLVPAGTQKLYPRPILRPTSLSPDATRLALPQPDALVVVDLTQGTSRRYDVPGPANLYPVWIDETHVLVTAEAARHGTVVDLTDGTLAAAPYGETTAFADGTTVTWGPGGPTHSTLVWGDGRRVHTLGDNGGGFFPQPPLVRDDVVVGVGPVYSDDRTAAFGTIGINVVDGSSGKVLAYLPLTRGEGTQATLLGWAGDRPLVGIPHPGVVNLDVFAWDWRHASLDPVASVPATDVSWGTGRLPPARVRR